MPPSPTAFGDLNDQALAVFQRFGSRWTMVVASLIEPGPIRFGELHRKAKGISRKMLTQTLRSLERDGIVERRVLGAAPLAVEYTFTELGWSLCPALIAMREWAKENAPLISEAQKRFEEVKQSRGVVVAQNETRPSAQLSA